MQRVKKDPRRRFAHHAKSEKGPLLGVCTPCKEWKRTLAGGLQLVQRVKKSPRREFAAHANNEKDPLQVVRSPWNDQKGPSQEVCSSCKEWKSPLAGSLQLVKQQKRTLAESLHTEKPQKCTIPTPCKPRKPQKCTIPTPCKPRKPQKIPLASFTAFSNNQKNQLTKTLHLRITRKIWWWRRVFWCAGFRCSQFFLASAPSKRAKYLPSYNALDAQP